MTSRGQPRWSCQANQWNNAPVSILLHRLGLRAADSGYSDSINRDPWRGVFGGDQRIFLFFGDDGLTEDERAIGQSEGAKVSEHE